MVPVPADHHGTGCAKPPRWQFPHHPAPLEQALLESPWQGDVPLAFFPLLVADRHNPRHSHRYRRPLAILLQDTHLHAGMIDNDAFVLKPLRQSPTLTSAGTGELPAIPANERPIGLSGVQANAILPRSFSETFQPVAVIDRQKVEASGYQTLFELLRVQPKIRVENAPATTSDGSTCAKNGVSGTTGAASAVLHGLGTSATPILIDGQSLIGYGLSQGQSGTTGNFDSIPLAMVERVKITHDGTCDWTACKPRHQPNPSTPP